MSRMGLRALMIALIGVASLHGVSHAIARGAAQSNETFFTVTGILITSDETPIKDARVFAIPVGADLSPVKIYAFDELGRQQLTGPSAKSDSQGRFSIEIPRDYKINNKRFTKWYLMLPNFGPPGQLTGLPTDVFLELNGRSIFIEVHDKAKSVDLGKITVK